MPISSGRRSSDAINNAKLIAGYLLSIILLSVVCILSIIALAILRPNTDNAVIIATIVGIITPTNLSLVALIQRENHKSVNSRMDQLLALRTAETFTEGTLKGAASETDPRSAEKLLEIVSDPPPHKPA